MSEWPSSLKSPLPTAFQLDPGLELTTPPPTMLVRFICQTATCPLVFWSRMSDRPSLLKSPVPTACHAGPGLAATVPPPMMVLPFISQIAIEPPLFCHTRRDCAGGSPPTDTLLLAGLDVVRPSLTDHAMVRLGLVVVGEVKATESSSI